MDDSYVPANPGFYHLQPVYDDKGRVSEFVRWPIVAWRISGGKAEPVTPYEHGRTPILCPDERTVIYERFQHSEEDVRRLMPKKRP